jgi:hypothetical protein
MMMRCPKCGRFVSYRNLYCPNCKARVARDRCRVCGLAIPRGMVRHRIMMVCGGGRHLGSGSICGRCSDARLRWLELPRAKQTRSMFYKLFNHSDSFRREFGYYRNYFLRKY